MLLCGRLPLRLPLSPSHACVVHARRPRVQCVRVTSRQAGSKPPSKRKGTVKNRRKTGFSAQEEEPQKEAWEKELIPQYRIYYKRGYKPGRFRGPIDFRRTPSGSCSVVLEEDVAPAQLLCISHPLFFMEGKIDFTPSVEDLHTQLLETPPASAECQVVSLLPTRPALKLNRPKRSAAAVAADTIDSSSSSSSQQPDSEPGYSPSSIVTSMASSAVGGAASTSESEPSSSEKAESIPPEQLTAGFWRAVGEVEVEPQPLNSGELMRTLQLSCWAEEYRDPGASQVRHELPAGFLGVWPEHAYLEHSCAPNTSAVVVGKYMYIHSIEELAAGSPLTFNKIGTAVMGPLGVRTAASLKLFGRPCSCRRCKLESQLPAEAAEQLKAVYEASQGEWAAAVEAAAEDTDLEAVAAVQATMSERLRVLEESLAVAGLDEEDMLTVRTGAYPAYDMLWQLEELLSETPELQLLEDAIDLMQVFSPGSADHVYACMVLNDFYLTRLQPLVQEVMKTDGKARPTRVRRLQRELAKLQQPAELAETKFLAAMFFRYGYIGQEGLFPQLQQGMALFYQGLQQLSAEQAGEGPRISELEYDGIPVTVVDTAGVGRTNSTPLPGVDGEEVLEEVPALVADVAAGEQEESSEQQEPADIDSSAADLADKSASSAAADGSGGSGSSSSTAQAAGL